MILIEKAKAHWHNQLPFVLFRKPNQQLVKSYFQLDAKLYSFEGQKGFVFQSFNHDKSCCLPFQKSIFSEEIIIQNQPFELKNSQNLSIDENEKDFFIKSITKAKTEIENKTLEKVVLSRKIKIEISDNHDIFENFISALNTYPSAFVYLFYHPQVGLWLGATPELLLSISKQTIETVSLAGTKLKEADTSWTPKEIFEQEVVTQYIKSQLEKHTSNIQISDLETIKAGHLEHLSTKISGELMTNYSILDMLKDLHPTPAVCGLPRQVALDFINKNENYERSFYAGFLGEHLDEQTDFYVNLRCMQKIENFIELYVGCGITADSDPEKEFIETVNKSKTMLQIL